MDSQYQSSPPTQPPVVNLPSASNKKRPILVVGLILLSMTIFTGAIFIGIKIGEKKNQTQIPINNNLISPTKNQSNPTITPTIDPTINWKTFTSPRLGFTFKYPSEYPTPEEKENYLALFSPLNPNRDKGYQLENGELKIEIIKEAAKENDSSTKCFEDHSFGTTKIISQSDIIISAIKTTAYNYEGGEGTGKFICIIYNKQRYLINKYPFETTRDAEFNQIISTFKFLSSASSLEISGTVDKSIG